MTMNDSLISVLLPTRERPGMLRRSIDSLRDNAYLPEQIEFCVAVDPDDTPPEVPGIKVHIPPSRYGYGLLHEYYNDLARMASGDWLFIWNDDAIMLTPGWDSYIREQSPALLWSYVPEALGMNVFPVVPAVWAKQLGHLSLNHSIDMWLIDVGERLTRRIRHIPVTISHQKVQDTTAQSRNMAADVFTFHTNKMVEARIAEAVKLEEFFAEFPANPRLVSVIFPDIESLPQHMSNLLNLAADAKELEFLVGGGDRNYA